MLTAAVSRSSYYGTAMRYVLPVFVDDVIFSHKMRSETVYFAPGAATWRTRNAHVVFDSGPFTPLYISQKLVGTTVCRTWLVDVALK